MSDELHKNIETFLLHKYGKPYTVGPVEHNAARLSDEELREMALTIDELPLGLRIDALMKVRDQTEQRNDEEYKAKIDATSKEVMAACLDLRRQLDDLEDLVLKTEQRVRRETLEWVIERIETVNYGWHLTEELRRAAESEPKEAMESPK